MTRLTSITLAVILLTGLVSAMGCSKSVNPNVASAGLDLALQLRLDNAAVADHFADLKEAISLEKGKVKFKELRGEDLETKSWCFMKYTMGESEWGIVPGTVRDCTDEDDDASKKRAKKRAKRWLNSQTEADEVRSEIDYLMTDGWYKRGVTAAAQSVVSGFDFTACVTDAISVETTLSRRLADTRCEQLMDNEEIAVAELLGSRGLEGLGVDLDNVDDEETEKAMKKFLGKLNELTGDDAAAFLMIVKDGWGTACFDTHYLSDDEAARATMIRKAGELCGDVAEAAAGDD